MEETNEQINLDMSIVLPQLPPLCPKTANALRTKANTTPATAQARKEPAQSTPLKHPVLSVIKDIQRQTRKQYSAEEKIRIIRIVLEGLRGESSVAEICRREGINTNIYYRWSKELLEAGKKRLMGDTIREATAQQ